MKTILIKFISIVGIAVMLFSLFGCSNSEKRPTEEMSYVSMTQNHMNSASCYSFSVYKGDDVYVFNAWCTADNQNIDFENVKITDEEFQYFKALDEKYDFFLNERESKKHQKAVADATIRSFKVSYGLEEYTLKTEDECYEEAYNCFISLAKKYSTK